MTKNNYEPFDLERALKGDKFICRNGDIPSDWHCFQELDESPYCIHYIVKGKMRVVAKDGRYDVDNPHESGYDLFMLPKPIEFYNIVFKSGLCLPNYYSILEIENFLQLHEYERKSALAIQKTTITGNNVEVEIVHKY